MLSKNKEYIVDIVDIGQGGVGIGKYEGLQSLKKITLLVI